MIKSLLLFVSIILLSGCMPVKKEEIYGKYLVEFPFGSQTLKLNRDGTYEQIVIITWNADTTRHNGKWKYSDNYTYILLFNGLSVVDPYCSLRTNYKIPIDGIVVAAPIQYLPWFTISLTTGCEEYYYKQIEYFPDTSSTE
ncbi:MAG: hypothetical protein KAR42_01065 [candidate division Zixibacteria bacterium]|nr:hypothetical protein [candidate division Zixibacteria bacterium]